MEIQTIKDKFKLADFLESKKAIKSLIYKSLSSELIKDLINTALVGLINDDLPLRINIVIHPTVKAMLKDFSEHHKVNIEEAYANLLFFLDLEKSSKKTNDILKIGAFFQNLSLAAHNSAIGLIWVDDIHNNQEEILNIFKFDSTKYQLLCIAALGNIGEFIDEDKPKKSAEGIIEFY